MRREERVTVQGPVKEQQPDGMSHMGSLGCPSPGSCDPSVPGDGDFPKKQGLSSLDISEMVRNVHCL